MFRTFLISASRNLLKNKGYTFLNVLGLSAGLACFAFIALWVIDESGYDKFNRNYDRIVRLTGLAKTETGISESAVSSAPMAAALKNDYPEVENAVRMDMNNDAIVDYKGQKILEKNLLFTDPSFFEIFSYPVPKGFSARAIEQPYTIILTESTAKKYFGDTNPVGQTLTMYLYDAGNKGALFTITGVIPDAPANSHFQYNIIGSFKTVETVNPDVLTIDGWGDAGFYTYLLLKKGVDPVVFSSKISQFYAKYIGERYKIWKDIYFYKLQPLRDIHLRSHLEYEIAPTGNAKQLYIFSTIGIFILLLAGINYMNLAIAHSAGRAKEVGIKKLVGAGRNSLVFQYLTESVLTSLLSFLIAMVIGWLLQPAFFQLTGKNISLFSSGYLIVFLALVSFLLGILSGIYPALVISGFRLASVLKGSFKTSAKGIILRKSLVVFQFAITLILVTGIIVINSQMSFIGEKDLGYDNETLISIKVNGNTDVINGYDAFKNDLLSKPLVKNLAKSNTLPISGMATGGATTVDRNGSKLEVNTARLRVDTDYLSTYGIKLISGRNFSASQIADSITPVLLNEAAVRNFGWQDPNLAIGKPFSMGGKPGTVIGVVKDFNFASLQKMIEPLVMFPLGERFSRITVRADMSKSSEVIAWVGNTWKRNFPGALFDYRVLDEQIGEQYVAQLKFEKIFLYFSVLSLLIACLGLYGLISYVITQKTKEIGIRKIIGASVRSIVMMLSGNFLVLILVSLLIAVPVAWVMMNKWLQDFAFRIHIGWWVFAVSAGIVVLIAMLTLCSRAIRAAFMNPVKSLRTD